MKLKFKIQPFQTSAVESIVDCFAGQVNTSGIGYRIDPGRGKRDQVGRYQAGLLEYTGFKNSDMQLTDGLGSDHAECHYISMLTQNTGPFRVPSASLQVDKTQIRSARDFVNCTG